MYKYFIKRKDEFLEVSQLLPQKIQQHNNDVANNRIIRAYELLGDVEGRKLDRQQMICIVKEAHNHLVIAGAGTGKGRCSRGQIYAHDRRIR